MKHNAFLLVEPIRETNVLNGRMLSGLSVVDYLYRSLSPSAAVRLLDDLTARGGRSLLPKVVLLDVDFELTELEILLTYLNDHAPSDFVIHIIPITERLDGKPEVLRQLEKYFRLDSPVTTPFSIPSLNEKISAVFSS